MQMRVCTVPLSPEPLLFTPVNIGSSRKFTRTSLHTVRVVLFLRRGALLHAFYFAPL